MANAHSNRQVQAFSYQLEKNTKKSFKSSTKTHILEVFQDYNAD